jgi:hypothetical protein
MGRSVLVIDTPSFSAKLLRDKALPIDKIGNAVQ